MGDIRYGMCWIRMDRGKGFLVSLPRQGKGVLMRFRKNI